MENLFKSYIDHSYATISCLRKPWEVFNSFIIYYSGSKNCPNVFAILATVVHFLEPLRRLWCNATLQSRLVLELQTMDSQWQEQRVKTVKIQGFRTLFEGNTAYEATVLDYSKDRS